MLRTQPLPNTSGGVVNTTTPEKSTVVPKPAGADSKGFYDRFPETKIKRDPFAQNAPVALRRY
jgi:hypothetical protein